MNQIIVRLFAVIAVWLFCVYIMVGIFIFLDEIKHDWEHISLRSLIETLVRSLLWIRDFFE
jgi:hypothetical protein